MTGAVIPIDGGKTAWDKPNWSHLEEMAPTTG